MVNRIMGCKGKLTECLDRKNFKPKSLRSFVMGVTITTTFGEIIAYKLIKQDVRAGEIPYYTPDILIIVFSIFEALIAPVISWLGYQRRRTILIWFSFIATVSCLLWFFIPNAGERNKSGLCETALDNTLMFESMTSRSIARLVIVVLTCTCFVLARIACWCHGIAYTDEYAPEGMSVHYGVILISRVTILLFGDRMMTELVDSHLYIYVASFLVCFLIFYILVPFIIPKGPPEVDGVQKIPLPLEERGFMQSLGRVVCNLVAMMQMLAMGLMAAAIWGYIYYENEIIKVRFNVLLKNNTDFTDFLIYHYVVIAVVFASVLFSPPVVTEFCKLKAIKRVILMSLASCIIYVVLTTVPRCDRGEVAGLEHTQYDPPACSLSCNCHPHWDEFKPVCAVDNMVTYSSPCQAGCADSSVVNGIQVYSNCTCSPNGQVVLGACSDDACKKSYRFHSVLIMVVVTFTSIALHAQGVLLLRVVDPRDKSVMMGLTWSMVAIIAFVCGHLIFFGIHVSTCTWYGDNVCLLQTQLFPYYVGGTSVVMALMSTLISIISWICIRV